MIYFNFINPAPKFPVYEDNMEVFGAGKGAERVYPPSLILKTAYLDVL